jgi:hypothetical protein
MVDFHKLAKELKTKRELEEKKMEENQDPSSMWDSPSDLEDVNKFAIDTDYNFEIASIGPRVKTTSSFYRRFIFRTFVDGEVAEVKQNLFAWELKLMVEMFKLEPKKVNLIDEETGEPFQSSKIDWNDVVHRAVKGRVRYRKYKYNKDGEEKTGSAPEIKIQCALDYVDGNTAVSDDTEEIPF